MCSVIIMHIIYSFWKASVWLTANPFMSPQNCALCYFYTWCWDRLISYYRITNVWSEWMVCTVCSYIDWRLTLLFLLFSTKDCGFVTSPLWWKAFSWCITFVFMADTSLTSGLSFFLCLSHHTLHTASEIVPTLHLSCCRAARIQNVLHTFKKKKKKKHQLWKSQLSHGRPDMGRLTAMVIWQCTINY